MIPATAYAVSEAGGKFALYNFERRQPAADDVLVRIHYCGKLNFRNNNCRSVCSALFPLF